MKKKGMLLAAVAASAFVAVAPLQTHAATDVFTTVDKAVMQMQKAYHTYSDVTANGQFADIKAVYKQYNAAKAAYTNAKTVVKKSGGKDKEVELSKLDGNYKTYLTERVVPYIDAYNYVEQYVKPLKVGLEEAKADKDLSGVEENYHGISYQLKDRTAIIYRVYGKTTRDLFKVKKDEAQTLRDEFINDVTVSMKTEEAQMAIEAGNLDAAKAAVDQINMYLPYITDTFKDVLQPKAMETVAAYKATQPPVVEKVNAINGTLTVTLDKEVTEVPSELVVFQNEKALDLAADAVKIDGNTLVITVPTVERTTEKQVIVYGVRIASGQIVQGAAVNLEALVAPKAPVITGVEGGNLQSATPAVIAVDGVTYTAALKKNHVEVPGYMLGSKLEEEGQYELTVTAEHDGLTATTTENFTVDTTAPTVTLDQAELTVYDNQYMVEGTTEAGATVMVNGEAASIDSQGHFSKAVTLTEGANQVNVVAVDAAGNQSRDITKAVTYVVKVTNVYVTTSATVKIGGTKQLTATVNPSNATDKTVTWASSNPSVATVDEHGMVTGVSEGTVTITAFAANGSSNSSTVTVSDRPQLYRAGYSTSEINGSLRSFTMQIASLDDSPVSVEKVEIYQNGKLYSDYTASKIANAGLETTINPYGTWTFGLTFNFGLSTNNSYMKLTVKTSKGQLFDYQYSLN